MNIYDYSLIVTTCDMTPWFDCHKCILCSYNSSSITNKAKIVTFQFIMNIILHNARTDCPWCLLLPHHNFGHLKGFIHNHTPSREVYDIKLNYCKKNGYARLVIFIIFFITSGDLVMLMRITTTPKISSANLLAPELCAIWLVAPFYSSWWVKCWVTVGLAMMEGLIWGPKVCLPKRE